MNQSQLSSRISQDDGQPNSGNHISTQRKDSARREQMQESSLLLYSALPSRSLSYAKLMKNVICEAVLATIKSSNMLYNIYLRFFTCPVFPSLVFVF